MGSKPQLAPREWVGVAVTLGIGTAGVWMIRVAIADPEPTGKIGMLLLAGAVCVLGGGSYAVYILTN